MSKKHLLWPLALVWAVLLNAQENRDRSFGAFPMIPQTFAARAAAREKEKIQETPAFKKAQKVYQRLVETRGDYRYPVPTFNMTRKMSRVASIDYTGPEIFLEEKAFLVCDSFGAQSEAAIAFLLGHELTHYYEKHAWRGSFADENRDLTIAKQLESIYSDLLKSAGSEAQRALLLRFDTLAHQFQGVERESQADYLGGFLSYAAGYGIFERSGELIGRLYRAYGLKPNMPGYVTREERQAMSNRSAERMKSLVDVFEMANLLTATGRYEEALQYYRFVLLEYQSREVYNNVGAVAMLHALKLFQKEEWKYRLPVQLDLEAAASKGPDDVAKRNKLLLQAIQHFDAAISLDPDYAPAYLNKACAYTLLGDTVRAQYYAAVETRDAAARGKYAKIAVDAEIVLGVLQALEGKKAKAVERLTAILPRDPSGLAEYNLLIMNDKPLPAAPEAPGGFFPDEEIDGVQAAALLYPEEDRKPMQIDADLSFHQNGTQGKNSRLLFSSRAGGNTLFLLTRPNYPGKTARGMKLGDNRKAIVAKYGPPPRSIATPTGEIMAYPDILFILKKDDLGRDFVLARWALFKEP